MSFRDGWALGHWAVLICMSWRDVCGEIDCGVILPQGSRDADVRMTEAERSAGASKRSVWPAHDVLGTYYC